MLLILNHSFNAFIEINDKSNSSKTTLTEIVKGIYGQDNDSVSANYTLDSLNDNFPFRGMSTLVQL